MYRPVKMAIVGALLAVLAYPLLRNAATSDPSRDACGATGGESGRLCSSRSVVGSLPVDARAFVDTIGVNTHLFYVDTAYGDYAMVRQRLRELGIRHIRDGLDPGRTPLFFKRVNDLGAAGIKSTLIACRVEPPGVPWTTYVEDAKRKVRSSLDALEGVNEPDLVAAGTDWVRSARRCQREMHHQAKHDTHGPPLRVPVLGPAIQAGAVHRLGEISDRADGGTIHPYAGGMRPSRPGAYGFASQMASVRKYQFGDARVPVYATETGYHDAMNTASTHPPASQRAIAIYMPRLFLQHAKAGLKRTFAYELVDEHPDPALTDVELNYGLFESDWSYKPSATALANTITLLNSRRRSPRSRLRYSLSNTADPDGPGSRGAVEDMLLQKGDGSYWLALWQDSTVWDENARTDIRNASTAVGVTLDRSMTLTNYRPTESVTPSHRVTARSFTVDVGDDVLLVRMRESPAPRGVPRAAVSGATTGRGSRAAR
ncbi:MAG: hypothetical protein KY463_03195 [Actinobacteria bacterium]|nr:hypothetical protein [Actinomycetota bacterium]